MRSGVHLLRRPVVAVVEHATSSKNRSALVGELCHVGELMAVELEHSTKSLLLGPLTVQALANILHVQFKHVNLCLVVKGSMGVFCYLVFVLKDLLGVELVVSLSLRNSLGQLKHLESQCFNRNDLIRVDVHLLLIAVLISERLLKVVVMHCVLIVCWHDWAGVAILSRSCSSGSSLCLSLGLSSSCGLNGGLSGNSGINCSFRA